MHCTVGYKVQYVRTKNARQPRHSLGEGRGEIKLVETVARSQNLGWGVLGNKKVDDVDESVQTIQVLVADGDEGARNAGRNTNGVLNAEVLGRLSILTPSKCETGLTATRLEPPSRV